LGGGGNDAVKNTNTNEIQILFAGYHKPAKLGKVLNCFPNEIGIGGVGIVQQHAVGLDFHRVQTCSPPALRNPLGQVLGQKKSPYCKRLRCPGIDSEESIPPGGESIFCAP
jgi:hypothetical protein